jgi:hypothetical protein
MPKALGRHETLGTSCVFRYLGTSHCQRHLFNPAHLRACHARMRPFKLGEISPTPMPFPYRWRTSSTDADAWALILQRRCLNEEFRINRPSTSPDPGCFPGLPAVALHQTQSMRASSPPSLQRDTPARRILHDLHGGELGQSATRMRAGCVSTEPLS